MTIKSTAHTTRGGELQVKQPMALRVARTAQPARNYKMLGTAQKAPLVYLDYQGPDQEPIPFADPETGENFTRFEGLRFEGVNIFEEGDHLKLNVFFSDPACQDDEGLMLTGGLRSYWAQGLLCALLDLADRGDIGTEFDLDTWRGTRGRMPLFVNCYQGRRKLKQQALFNHLEMARISRFEVLSVMRAGVHELQLKADGVEVAEVSECADDDSFDGSDF